jgi:hypothetical protein
VILPGRPGIGSLAELAALVLAERFHAGAWQRDRPARAFRLGRHKAQRPADSLEGLDGFELAAVEIDVFPAEAEQLAAAEAEEQRQHVERAQPVRMSRLQDRLRLRCGQAAVHHVLRDGDLDQPGRVARDDLLPDGAFQRIPQDGVHELDHARRESRLAARAAFPGAAPWLLSLRVPAVLAALAFLPELGEQAPDILRAEPGQPLPAKGGNQVQPHNPS